MIGLTQRLGKDKSVTNEVESKDPPLDLLPQLQVLWNKLDEYDAEAEAEDVIDHILDTVEGTPIHSSLTSVKKQITRFDTEAAAAELKPLIEELQDLDDGA